MLSIAALLTTGRVVCWGSNGFAQQLGVPVLNHHRRKPRRVRE